VSAEQQVPEGVDPETGEVTEPPTPEPEPDTPFEEPEPETEPPEEEPEEGEPEAKALTVADVAAMSEQEVEAGIRSGQISEDLLNKAVAKQERDAAKTAEKLEAERQRHQGRLAEILQEDILRLVPCELCRADLAGWIDSTGPIPEEVKQRVRIQIGDREPENWQEDPHSARCSACDGLGEVQTGSRVRGQEVMPCVDCGGKGWQPTDDTRSGLRPPAVVPHPPILATDEGNGAAVSHPALSAEDQAEIKRLQGKGIVVIVPQPA
jgi:hypothetical protein